jgi:excisionase family DNA binding protein
MRLITAREASTILGLRLPRVYELARSKRIPFVRLGIKQIRFDPELLQEWIKNEANLNATLGSHEGVNDGRVES